MLETSIGLDRMFLAVLSSALREEMLERAPTARTVPQIFIGATHVGGSDELAALEREGKLDALLTG